MHLLLRKARPGLFRKKPGLHSIRNGIYRCGAHSTGTSGRNPTKLKVYRGDLICPNCLMCYPRQSDYRLWGCGDRAGQLIGSVPKRQGQGAAAQWNRGTRSCLRLCTAQTSKMVADAWNLQIPFLLLAPAQSAGYGYSYSG